MQLEAWLMLFTCIFWSELQAVLGSWDRTCTPFTRSFGPHPSGICGRRIDETLSLLCMGDYNEGPSFFRKKRETENNVDQLKRNGILIPRENANSYLVKRSNFYQQGIVCECCYHRCGLMELFSYCRHGPGLFGLFKRSTDRQKRLSLHNIEND